MSKLHWFAAALLTVSNGAIAGEREDLQQLRDTTLNLINLLVEEGALSKDKAAALVSKAQQPTRVGAVSAPVAPAQPDPGVVRVPYVPQLVREQIRDEIKKEVLAQARSERWGDPGTLPEWIDRIKWEGDLRVRAQNDYFQDDNFPFVPNYLEINKKGNIADTTNPYQNSTENRSRVRLRARLGMEAQVSSNVLVGMRVTTGNTADPVSTNVTIGTSNNRYTAVFDRAFVRYEPRSWLAVNGGKMANPWLGTDLIWDDDLNFDGVAATFRYDNNFSLSHQWQAYATLGLFPLQEVELSASDKWLTGAQLGLDYKGSKDRRARVGVALYDYRNITGERNSVGSHLLDHTAPQYLQKGNTMYNISNDVNNPDLYALAGEYRLFNLTGLFDLASFGRTRVSLSGDYVKNIGFDRDEILARSGMSVDERDTGYLGRLAVGMPEIKGRGDWQVSATYKYLEGDAVLDAFTDSDFHLGGTNAKGWILGGQYGLERDTWLSMKWLSADEIDGPPLAIDVLQLDLNTRF